MGKFLAIVIVLSAVLAGGALYYTQVYGFYYEVEPVAGQDVMLIPADSDTPEPIAYSNFRAINADSSPIRYRACFETDLRPDDMSARYVPALDPVPLTAPGWFDCYDAALLADALDAGQARAFVAVKNVHYGVDRIVAVTDQGRGYAWHALNDCGEKAYDGTVIGEECPPRPQQ